MAVLSPYQHSGYCTKFDFYTAWGKPIQKYSFYSWTSAFRHHWTRGAVLSTVWTWHKTLLDCLNHLSPIWFTWLSCPAAATGFCRTLQPEGRENSSRHSWMQALPTATAPLPWRKPRESRSWLIQAEKSDAWSFLVWIPSLWTQCCPTTWENPCDRVEIPGLRALEQHFTLGQVYNAGLGQCTGGSAGTDQELLEWEGWAEQSCWRVTTHCRAALSLSCSYFCACSFHWAGTL